MSAEAATALRPGASPAPSSPVSPGVLRRKCACGGSPGAEGECAACRKKKLTGGGTLQRKLAVGSVHDLAEREADRVADRVMRMANPGAGVAPDGPSVPGTVRRRADGGGGAGEAPPIVHDVLSSPGRPLDAGTRHFFEPRFGRDLSHVRVHSDARAAESARAVGAEAYTVGSKVVFGDGRYVPGSDSGRRLLAHELAHVEQQGLSRPCALRRQEEGGGSAERLATSYRRVRLVFNGDELIVFGDDAELFRYGASSGRPIQITEEDARACGGDRRVDTYMSPRFTGIRNQGPIPEGTFRFRPSRIQKFSAGEQWDLLLGGVMGKDKVTVQGQAIHAGDWGAGRVALEPVRIKDAPCGNPRARSGFFLHGGILPGSSGCIDIGTSFDELAAFLKGYPRPVTVEVHYEQETPRVGFWTGFGGGLAYKGFHFRHGPTARLGMEYGSGPNFVLSGEYQTFLDWAGGALSAGVHVDVPMSSEETFIRAGLRGGAEFRILHALYGQAMAGGFVEPAPEGGATGGFEVGGGLEYDFGRVELSLLYNYLNSAAREDRHQVLLGLGFHWP